MAERFSSLTLTVNSSVMIIYRIRKNQVMALTKRVYGEMLFASFALQWAFILMDVLMQDHLFIAISPIFFIFVPMLMIRELKTKADRVKRSIVIDLPELMTKVALMVNAGDTLQSAILRCADGSDRNKSSRLLQELSEMKRDVALRKTFPEAMEQFSRRCAVQEVSMFVSAALIHYRRGGDEIVLKLRELTREGWEKRKNITKTLGEEASSKMVFPMVIVFFVIMVIVTAPAILMMNN